MNLTRAARSTLADPRRGFASVLTVMFLVLAILGVQAVCGVHLDQAGHASAPLHGAVGQHAAPAVATTPDQAAEAAPGYHDPDPTDCAEDRTENARYDRTLSPSTDLVGVAPTAVQWLVPDHTHLSPRASSDLVAAAAPSLHALGISRT
ncbi:hypothetical protein [Promicromonospora soli]